MLLCVMTKVGICKAKMHFSKLLRRVAAGEEIIITKRGKPIARLVPVKREGERVFGRDRGLFEVPENFDALLPDGALSGFEC